MVVYREYSPFVSGHIRVSYVILILKLRCLTFASTINGVTALRARAKAVSIIRVLHFLHMPN